MANGEALPIPAEIGWRLASTSQALKSAGPDDTTISLFTFEPDEEAFVDVFPGQKIVYLKLTVSISPMSLADVTAVDVVRNYFDDTIPVYALQLDLKVKPEPLELGGIRPYFHSAAPLHRRVIETGVVGDDLYEGEADSQFIGRSGSQLQENLSSRTNTRTGQVGLQIAGFGASGRTSTTNVTSERAVDQVVDTTTRDASQERRELISHMTNVENVLTLLNAKHVGSPYLRFSLYPRPLRPLSVDPADPNLWFSQLLARRSSGIEGVQEFTAIVVVPRDQALCVEASLRRVCVLDDPPGPPDLSERYVPDLLQLARQVDYLYALFPIGTPLEELDVDLTGKLGSASDFPRPAVRLWAFRLGSLVCEAVVVSPGNTAGTATQRSVNYKHLLEIWLETLRAEHETELARSPLERGVVLAQSQTLRTCFATGDGGLGVTDTSSVKGPVVKLPFEPGLPERPSVDILDRSARAASIRTVVNWNALEGRLAQFVSNQSEFPDQPVTLDDPAVVELVTARWAKLGESDPRNLPFKEVAARLWLSVKHTTLLEQAGVADIRGLGQALNAANTIERQNLEIERFVKELPAFQTERGKKRKAKSAKSSYRPPRPERPEPIEFPVKAEIAQDIRKAIGEAFGSLGGGGPPRKRPTKKRT
jgi:hypothetical protein